jgi:hypothetical protein
VGEDDELIHGTRRTGLKRISEGEPTERRFEKHDSRDDDDDEEEE